MTIWTPLPGLLSTSSAPPCRDARITHRGEAVAVISPINQEALREALVSEAGRAERETLGWLAASESAFSFWDNEDDAIWDETRGRVDDSVSSKQANSSPRTGR